MALIIVSNLSIVLSPIHTLINILLISLVIFFAIKYGEIKEKYESGDPDIADYSYEKEDPNITTHGRNYSGTVYGSYPTMTSGMGWII